MTNPENESNDRFLLNDPVRLIASHGERAAGASGHIVGRFAGVDPKWVVSFDGDSACVEVRGDEIAPAAA
jgi:hypothetical protein